MTSIEFIHEKLFCDEYWYEKLTFEQIIEQAKEMHKQEIMNTYIIADSESTKEDSEHNALKFYERTYVSKGSDTLKDYHIVDTNEMVMSEKPTNQSDKWKSYQDWLNNKID